MPENEQENYVELAQKRPFDYDLISPLHGCSRCGVVVFDKKLHDSAVHSGE